MCTYRYVSDRNETKISRGIIERDLDVDLALPLHRWRPELLLPLLFAQLVLVLDGLQVHRAAMFHQKLF